MPLDVQLSPIIGSDNGGNENQVLVPLISNQNCDIPTASSSPCSNFTSTETYICIIKDMTDASRGGRPQPINLSSSYTVEKLIQQAAKFFSYAADSFALVWKNDDVDIVR
jgi:hypothetical protein